MPHLSLPLARRACLLASVLLLLSACRGPAEVKPPNPTSQSIQAPSTAAPTRVPPTAAPTVPPTLTPLARLDRPIIWYLRGESPPDLPQVNERLNRLLAEQGLHASVEMRVVEQSAFERRMADVLAAGEAWDIVSLTASSYPGWVENHSLLPLTAYPNPKTEGVEDLLAQQAPWLLSWMGPASGNYAITNPADWARPRGVSIRADVVRALNLQPDLDRARSFADLTPILDKIQAAVQDGTLKDSGINSADRVRRVVGQANMLQPENAGYDRLWGPFAVRYDDVQGRVINWYQSAEFRDLANLRRDWQVAGYFPDEPLTPDQVIEGYRSGQYVVEVGRPVWAGSALEQAQRYGFEWIERPLGPPFLQTEAVLSSLTGVNARIANDPERVQRVMRFLALLHSNREIYNLLAYGIEGQHWRWTDRENLGISLVANSGYRPDFIDQLGDRSLSYAAEPARIGLWRVMKAENAKAPASIALGFIFDPRLVAAEAAAVRGLTPELLDPLQNGQAKNVDQSIGTLEKALDEAGLGAIQAELKKQWQAWMNAKR